MSMPTKHDDLAVFLIAIDIVQTRNNRQIEYSTAHQGGHRTNPYTATVSDLMCNPLHKHSAVPHFEQSAAPC